MNSIYLENNERGNWYFMCKQQQCWANVHVNNDFPFNREKYQQSNRQKEINKYLEK